MTSKYKIGYKCDRNGLVIKLRILGSNNSLRPNIIDRDYAKMLCGSVCVIAIYRKGTEQTVAKDLEYDIEYKVGHTVSRKYNYNRDCNEESYGIYYFTTIEGAKAYYKRYLFEQINYCVISLSYNNYKKIRINNDKGISGDMPFYNDDGFLYCELNIINGCVMMQTNFNNSDMSSREIYFYDTATRIFEFDIKGFRRNYVDVVYDKL